jgi:multiple sugar transport system permease protein
MRRSPLTSVLTYGGLWLVLLLFLFPVYWMVHSSFRRNPELTVMPPNFSLIGATLENYQRILSNAQYLTYYKNSFIVAGATVAICLPVAILAGYAFSRYRFPGRGLLMTGVLSVQMFPIVAILIALYTFYAQLRLLNTYTGLVLADVTFALPFSIWFMKSYFDGIPRALEEAAAIDGCGRLRTLFQIVVPLTRPGLLAVGVYTFLLSWDDFLFALTLITREELRTLPVGIALSFVGEFLFDWSGMMTISVIASLPVLVLFVAMQRHMIAGLTAGAVKG